LFFFVIIFTYFPLTVMLGGWDDYEMFIFDKAIALSGPSKPVFRPLYKIMMKCVKWAKRIGTHGKFPIPYEKAHQQVHELMEIKTKGYIHK